MNDTRKQLDMNPTEQAVNAVKNEPLQSCQDPQILQMAKNLYHAYLETHTKEPQRPLGVAVNPRTQQAKLIFLRKPVLLPMEQFIPFIYIETKAA